ncbi:mucin-4-like isoform X2 [Haliotis rubra]|uniref:mucin-4-like isoform X2 n=1 Tax=Haliotis rubra TaxID=36100 RepID=UPI001EE56DC4|nr:mucin-4-like isoform X2 [Haliotis rubra]
MYVIVSAVTVYNVLTLGYCQGNLLSQAVLTKNTSTSRTFVCTCSDAASCTADKWKDLLAECRQMLENIDHQTKSEERNPLEKQEETTSAQETTTSAQETTTSARETTTSAQETTTSAQETTTSAQETTTSARETTTLTQSPTTTASCVSDCTGVGNGRYQSCIRCDGYVECTHGNTHHRPCSAGTLWDDNKKSCQFPPSPTCVLNTMSENAQETTTPAEVTTTPTTTASCVSDCTGLGNGKYQSCERCDGYVECILGRKFNRPCSAGLLWDDNNKNCLFPPSPTCVP